MSRFFGILFGAIVGLLVIASLLVMRNSFMELGSDNPNYPAICGELLIVIAFWTMVGAVCIMIHVIPGKDKE